MLKHGPVGSEHLDEASHLDKTSHLDEIPHLNETSYVHCISNHNENSWNMIVFLKYGRVLGAWSCSWNMVCALGALNA